MHKLFVGIQISDKPQEFISLSNVDFKQDVAYLKRKISETIKFSDDVNSLELIFDGRIMANDIKLDIMRPNGIVHCFKKTKQFLPYEPSQSTKDSEFLSRIQDLFTLIAHIQINVTSRVTILQKILNEYPEFRINLGAQAIIRDSVLFNTIHQPETMKKIAENYPIIIEAAPFIVETVKKELARSNAAVKNFNELGREAAIDSPNSSEEENSLGASSSSVSLAESGSVAQNEDSRIRAITRQQLQDALAQVGSATNTNSVNSLSNIAMRNVDSSTATPLSSSASGELISAEMFRQHITRAFDLIATPGATSSTNVNAETSNTSEVQPMDTSTAVNDTNDNIPTSYRRHEYAEELRTMAQMGFLNHEENLTFLTLANGNIGNAINLLMGSMHE